MTNGPRFNLLRRPRDIFRRIDFNGDGTLCAAELRRGLHFLYKGGRSGCHIDMQEATDIINAIDEDMNDEINMLEFEAWCKVRTTSCPGSSCLFLFLLLPAVL